MTTSTTALAAYRPLVSFLGTTFKTNKHATSKDHPQLLAVTMTTAAVAVLGAMWVYNTNTTDKKLLLDHDSDNDNDDDVNYENEEETFVDDYCMGMTPLSSTRNSFLTSYLGRLAMFLRGQQRKQEHEQQRPDPKVSLALPPILDEENNESSNMEVVETILTQEQVVLHFQQDQDQEESYEEPTVQKEQPQILESSSTMETSQSTVSHEDDSENDNDDDDYSENLKDTSMIKSVLTEETVDTMSVGTAETTPSMVQRRNIFSSRVQYKYNVYYPQQQDQPTTIWEPPSEI